MRDQDLTERLASRELIYDGKIVHLEKWKVLLPNGKYATREIVRHVGAVAVVAVDGEGRAWMVRQYRAPLGRIMLEIPAGKLDSREEDPLSAAKRELREETGLNAARWEKLAEVVTTPGFCDERITVYLATELSAGAAQPDEDEFLDAERIPLSELYEKIARGEIHDGKTLIGLLTAKERLPKMGVN